MGRLRRRDRQESLDNHTDVDFEVPVRSGEILTPTYVTVTPHAWEAESDEPVLPLDGLQPWDRIAPPPFVLDEAPRESDFLRDSDDPIQLEFEPEAAVAVAEAVAPPAADPVELLYQEARAAAAAGQLAEARILYRRIINERPTHVGARNSLALLLEQNGDQPGALAEYDKAIELDGEHHALLNNRGALLGAMGRYAAAERDLKKVLRGDPSHVEGLFNLGVVMARKGLWAEAVPQLKRAIELDPARGIAHFYLGEALNHVDDLYGAMAAYQRATELLPGHSRALYGLGIVYDRLGRPDDAAQLYKRSREAGRR